jgi:hypothetical protein
LEIIRTGEKTLLVKALTGNILSTDTSRKDFIPNFVYFYNNFNILFRPKNLPFQVGERTELGDMSAEILKVDGNGQPTQVLFRFAVSLDDPSLSWFKWNWEKSGFGNYATFKVPAVGQTIHIEGPFSKI